MGYNFIANERHMKKGVEVFVGVLLLTFIAINVYVGCDGRFGPQVDAAFERTFDTENGRIPMAETKEDVQRFAFSGMRTTEDIEYIKFELAILLVLFLLFLYIRANCKRFDTQLKEDEMKELERDILSD